VGRIPMTPWGETRKMCGRYPLGGTSTGQDAKTLAL
jgi:hypothetical protein